MSINMDPARILPTSIVKLIFEYGSVEDLGNWSRVNKVWHQLADSPQVWTSQAERIFGCQIERDVPVRAMIKGYKEQQAKTNDEIVEHAENFLSKIKLGTNARFICHLGSQKRGRPVLIIELKSDTDRPSFDFQQECFAVNGLIGHGEVSKMSFPRPWVQYQEESYTAIPSPVNPNPNHSYKLTHYGKTASLAIPHLGLLMKTEMGDELSQLIRTKLVELDVPRQKGQFFKVIVAAQAALVATAALVHKFQRA